MMVALARTTLRVLIVEDSKNDAFFLLRELRRANRFELFSERVETAEAFVEALESRTWDAIICDYLVPGFGAMEALALLRERGLDLPFIVVSGVLREEEAVEAMRSGAHDFITKSNLARLTPAIEREVREAQVRQERRRAEERLAWLASFPMLTPNPIIEVDVAGELAYLNHAAEKHFPDLKALGKRHPMLEGLESVVAEIRDSGIQPSGREVRVGDRFYEQSISPALESDHLRIYALETTERRRAEEALRHNEEKFRALVQHCSDIIVVLDADGTILYESPASQRLLGVESEERNGTYAFAHLHPDDVEEVKSKFAKVLDGRADHLSAEYRVRHKDGSWRRFEAIGVNLLDNPAVEGIVVNTREITERVQAEEELREKENRLRLALDSTGLGMWDSNWITGEQRWDERCKAIFGLSPDASVTHEIFLEALHPEDRERVSQAVRRALDPSSGGRFEIEHRLVGIEDGVERWVADWGQAFYDEAGRAVRFIGAVLDITKRRRAEEAQRFLAEASALLSSSLDYRDTLTSVAHLAVSYIADWCVVDILEDGSLKSLAVAHRDPEKAKLGCELQERYLRDMDPHHPVLRVLSTERSVLVPKLTGSHLDKMARDAEHRKVLDELGLTSSMIVPLIARGRTLGVLVLVSAESGRRYGEAELKLAEELAHRAALAVDNAWLYGEVQRELAERKRAEKELRSSRDQLEIVLHGVTDGITAQDASGGLLFANEAAARITGYPSVEAFLEAAPGGVFKKFEIMDEAGRPFPLTDLPGRRALRGEPSPETLMCFRDVTTTEERWATVEAAPIRDDRGQVKMAVNIFRDITDRKRMEEAFRTSLKELSDLKSALDESAIVSIADPRGKITYVNDKFSEVSKYSKEEVIGQDHRIINSGYHPKEYIKNLWSTISRGDVWRGEFRNRAKDGTFYWVDATIIPLLNGEGKPYQYVSIRYEITPRKEAEEALRQSEELYRTVVEQAAENIYLVDLETRRIVEANPALSRLLGYSAEELRQLTLYDVVAYDKQSIDEAARRVVKEGRFFLGHRQYRRKDGSLMDLEVSVSTISYKGKETMCIVAHDVTAHKGTEDVLRRSLDALLALYEASQVLSSTLEPAKIVSRFLKIIQRVFGCKAVVISRPDENRQVRVWHAVGVEDLPRGARYTPEVHSAHLAVLETGEPRLFYLKKAPEEEDGDEEEEPLMGLCLPLRVKDNLIGLLEAYGPEDILSEEDSLNLLTSVTAQAASALENARLYKELAEREEQLEDLVGKLLVAQEEERRHVAYEVHDSVAQVAAAAHHHLQTFTRRYPLASEKGQENLRRVQGLVRQTLREARRIIAALRPEALDDFGLARAIYHEAEGLRADGWRVDYEEELGQERLPRVVETALFRVAQEALTNARKHAQTDRVRIELKRQNGEVSLEIRDWGRGFDPDALGNKEGPGERVGLSGMRERIHMLGGTLEVASRRGEGTRIRAHISLSAGPEDDQEEHNAGR